MHEDQLMDHLFESARNEESSISFEEVANRFNLSVNTGPLQALWNLSKSYFTNWIAFALVIGIAASVFLILGNQQQNEAAQQMSGIAGADSSATEAAISKSNKIENPQIQKTHPDKDQLQSSEQHDSPMNQKVKEDGLRTKSATSKSQDKEKSLEGDARKLGGTISKPGNDRIPANQPSDNVGQLSQEFVDDSLLEKEEPKDEHSILSEEKLELRRDNDRKAVEIFENVLRQSGLEIKTEAKFKQRGEILNYYACQFKHEKGLNFKLKGKGFQKLELSLLFDEDQRIHSFKYRFNDEEFSKPVPLDCKGYKTHIYAEGYSKKTGGTSIDIEH